MSDRNRKHVDLQMLVSVFSRKRGCGRDINRAKRGCGSFLRRYGGRSGTLELRQLEFGSKRVCVSGVPD